MSSDVPKSVCSNAWHGLIWDRWKAQVDVDLPRTFQVSETVNARVKKTIRIFSTYYSCGYFQGILLWTVPLHVIFCRDNDAFWATVHFFELLKNYYGPVINLRNRLNLEDSARVVHFYCATCRCNTGVVTRQWAARAREFVHWRIIAVAGLSLAKNIDAAVTLCKFFLKHIQNRRKFRRCQCALAYCILAGVYGRCTPRKCVCMVDCTFYEKLNKRQINAALQNVDFMSSLF